MEGKDKKLETEPVVMVVERRRQGREELTSAELIRISKKRSAKKIKGEPEGGAADV